jgi:hypothetical protein
MPISESDHDQLATRASMVSVGLYRSHHTCLSGERQAISLLKQPIDALKGPRPQHASLVSSNPAEAEHVHFTGCLLLVANQQNCELFVLVPYLLGLEMISIIPL